jgi:hypothetical protein
MTISTRSTCRQGREMERQLGDGCRLNFGGPSIECRETAGNE